MLKVILISNLNTVSQINPKQKSQQCVSNAIQKVNPTASATKNNVKAILNSNMKRIKFDNTLVSLCFFTKFSKYFQDQGKEGKKRVLIFRGGI